MKGGRDHIIQFAGLKPGEHEYEFTVTDKFFDDREYSEIKKADIDIRMKLLKQSTMMVMEFNISGTVKATCDRCAEEFDLPIEGDYRLIVKVGGHETGDEDDDIITIAANEHEIDLSQNIYEYIALSLPIRRVHPDDKDGNVTCDGEVLRKLREHLTEEEKNADPRWDQLKNIKLN